MFLTPFYSEKDGYIQILPEQASRFAKNIANDFNPIHNADAKRFCVPGDLLFALVLMKRGLYQNMHFQFQGMVGKGVELTISQPSDTVLQLVDSKEKSYLAVNYDGLFNHDEAVLESFIRGYVSFSGHNFIHILEPLMAKHRVMVNPSRPLVIYESMSFSIDNLNFSNPVPKLAKSTLTVDGKRGDVGLYFDIYDNGNIIGSGKKTLILSGLRPYDDVSMQSMRDAYNQSKAQYENALAC